MGDLSLRLVQAYLQEVKSDLFDASGAMDFPAVCERMHIVDGPAENVHPRNVGLLFFTDAPHRFFPQAHIDVVHFPEGKAGEIREQRFTGPLFTQLREALAYIQRTFIVERVIKRPGQAEADRFVAFPYPAVEEALANAVFHRGYDVREPIEVQITPTEMVITSYPGPDPSVRIDKLNEGGVVARRYRNRRIGEFLKELRLTEGRGTGVPTIFKAMQENGSPDPRFETDADRSYFSTILPVHEREAALLPGAEERPNSEPLRLLNERPRRWEVLRLCVTPRSRAELQGALGLRDVVSFRAVYLNPLLEAGLIAPTSLEHRRSPKQRYLATERGLALLEANEAR